MFPGPTGRRVAVLAVAILVCSTSVAAAGGAASQDPRPGFVVALDADGSAEVSVVLTFDLTTDDEREGFEAIRQDRENLTAAFGDRMSRLADRAAESTGRQMRVTDPTARVYTTDGDEVGVVELAVTWEGLAARTDDGLVLSAPFADGFTTDRRFTVRAPEGYALADAAPAPEETGDGSATWTAGSSLTGFRVAVEPASSAPSESSLAAGIELPVLVAGGVGLAALLAALVAIRRR